MKPAPSDHLFRLASFLAVLLALAGCSRSSETVDSTKALSLAPTGATSLPRAASAAIEQTGQDPPPGLVTVSLGSQSLSLWPYTGNSFDGVASDPVNLIFAGKADPVRIRAALLALDGDRSQYGIPPVPPFNARWSDAIGDVQTGYAEGEGWQGSTIQLQLGSYAPVRAHLRLFRTAATFGDGGAWTVGAAHFEVLIPGTADHQVLSWELAQQLVLVDMLRSGLLDPSAPFAPTGVISQAPSFREIPAVIYNELPDELKAVIGGPPGTVGGPVPIANDGVATIFHLTGEAPLAGGAAADRLTLQYDQLIPKPICSEGPLDWVHVSGPVELTRSTSLDETGRYQYHARIAGRLTVTPVDVTQDPPAPGGTPYQAEIGDLQQGALDATGGWALAQTKRIAPQPGGTEFVLSRLRVGSDGDDSYRAQSHCP